MKPIMPLLAGMAAMTLAPLAGADIYIGAGAYHAAVDERVSNENFDDSDTTGAFFLGWRPIELVGVEAGYYDFGTQEGDSGIELDGGALTLAGLLSLELGPVGLYGKAGLADSDFDIDHPSAPDDDDSSTDAFGGVGATVDVMDKLYVYAEYMHFDNEVKVDMLGAGLRWSF